MKSIRKQSVFVVIIALMALMCAAGTARAEWYFGIGTGLAFNNIDGEQGFNSKLLGPIKYDVKLDPKDFNDITKSAFGFGGYATDGSWLVQYTYANLELEDKVTESFPNLNSTVKLNINFKITGAELTVGYPVYRTPSVAVLVDGGVRYTKHKYDGKTSSTGAITGEVKNKFDNDWTDGILGVVVNVPIAETWTWANRLNAGYGGSDGTYLVSTGVTWRFHKNWSAGLTGKYIMVKYENGKEGDSDWYLYDADEASVGLNVLFNW